MDLYMNEELIKEIWHESNEIEQLNAKLNSCQSIISICAERLIGDESGALWAASDILQEIENKLDDRICNLFNVYHKLKNQKKVKKK